MNLHSPIVLSHLLFTVRYVDDGTSATTPILGVGADSSETFGIDPSGQSMPEGVLDHPRQPVDWIFGKTGLVQHDTLPPEITGQGKLLKKVGKHVRSLASVTMRYGQTHSDIESLVGVRTGGTEG